MRLGEPVEKVAWDESDDGGVTFCTRGGKVYKVSDNESA